ncbi:hypothetical protein LTR95_004131 [Oleoguttula sp. CCFEE 5521]
MEAWAIAELREQIIDCVVASERPLGYMRVVRKRRYGSRPFRSGSSLQSVSRKTASEYQQSLWRYLAIHAHGLVFMVPDLDFTEILKFFERMPPKVWTAIKGRLSSDNEDVQSLKDGCIRFSVQLEFSDALSKLAGKEEEMLNELKSLRDWAVFERCHELNISMYIPAGLRPKRWEDMRSMAAFDTQAQEAQRRNARPPYSIGFHAIEHIKWALDLVGEHNLVGPYWYFTWYQITSYHCRFLSPWQQLGALTLRYVGWRQKTGWRQTETRTQKFQRMIASLRVEGLSGTKGPKGH